ncbi:MAG: WD40 repeat domain-containing protein, partial [Methylocystis sp.]
MTDASPSLTANVAPIQAEEAVIAAAFLGAAPAFSLAHGVILMPESAQTRIFAHGDGALLCAASDGCRLVTGGDDGRLMATNMAGETSLIAEERGKWIDAVTLRPDGALAWSAGRV